MADVRTDIVPRQRQVPGEGAPEEAARGRGVYGRDPGGRTVVGEDVVEKAALQAVREVPDAHAVRSRSRSARARMSGEVVLLRLRIGVRYPRPTREVAGRVRAHVKEQIERITGKRVHHIDIEIAELVR